MGKYKGYTPHQAAQAALESLLAKIDQMKTNYAIAMDNFRVDREAQARYVAGVAAWIEAMRSPEVKELIYQAIARAKSIQARKIAGAVAVRERVAEAIARA